MRNQLTLKIMRAVLGAVLGAAALTLAATGMAEAASGAISYAKDVQPIFDKYCGACHHPGGPGTDTSGLDLTSYEGVMKGTKFGPIVVPGDALTSNLMAVLENRTDASIRMPHSNRRDMTKNDRMVLRRWIAEGATEEGFEAGPKAVIGDLCLDCHQPGGSGHEASGLDMTSYESLMKGTRHGPIIVPGDPFSSNLMVLVEGRATGGLKMPHKEHPAPTAQDRQVLRRWIAEGAQNN